MPFDTTEACPNGTDFAHHAEETQALVRTIGTICTGVEEAFLTVSNRLCAAQDEADELVKSSGALGERLAERGFQATMDRLSAGIEALGALQFDAGNFCPSIAEINAIGADIGRALNALAQIMTQMRFLGLNARIESAQLESTGNDFTVFTRGIIRLAGKGKEVVDVATADLDRLTDAAGVALSLQTRFAEASRRELSAIAARLTNLLQAMHAREESAAHLLHALPARFEAAHHGISVVVTDLQIGDAARQRLEHVDKALTTLGELLSGPESDGSKLSEWQIGVLLNAVADMEAGQLERLRLDLDINRLKTGVDIRGLVRTLEEITAATDDVYSGGEGDQSSFLLEIEAELEKVNDMVQRYGVALDDSRRSVSIVSEAAEAMIQSMRLVKDIDADINIMGLNASIKCGNLGDRARALNVIAQEMRSFARQTQNLSAVVGLNLERATRFSAELEGSNASHSFEGLRELRESLNGVLDQLHGLSAETSAALKDIHTQTRLVVTNLDRAGQDLQASRTRTDRIADIEDQLTALAARTDPGLERDELEAVRRQVLAFMQANYTMASEREVHDALLSGEHAAQPAHLNGEEFDVSDVLF